MPMMDCLTKHTGVDRAKPEFFSRLYIVGFLFRTTGESMAGPVKLDMGHELDFQPLPVKFKIRKRGPSTRPAACVFL